MQDADPKTVLGDFDNARVTTHGVTTAFFRSDGRYYVRTDGPHGKPGDFEIKYTFGVAPLQQYLIELPGGRLQALGYAWDTRPKAQGGQRWFHLYPDRPLRAGDPMHWTGIDQNWNHQCADCHSTNVRKGYDADKEAFKTTWSEISVGCEACHGPASNHIAWSRKEGEWRRFEESKGLTVTLDERRAAQWVISAASGNATRSRPLGTSREVEVCARCHARRSQMTDEHRAGDSLHDGFRTALIEPGLYHADGQQRDEVYNHGSFLQSKMFARGVTCSDCHDPHTGKLRADKNAVCATCHSAAKYDAPGHHRHAPNSQGSQCVACHMPTTTYMRVDPRHDHSMRIPRPDRSVTLGTPNACNQCHERRTPQWAADAVRQWYPESKRGFQTFAEAFHAAEQGAPGARSQLIGVVEDRAQPAIVRASALARLSGDLSGATLPTVIAALGDVDANVRSAAIEVVGRVDEALRQRYLPRMLNDPSRVVRIAAARALAGPAEHRLSNERQEHFRRAYGEYVEAQRFNADRPESHLDLGVVHLARGQPRDGERALRKALEIDRSFAPAAVNLADLLRSEGRETDAEAVLRSVLHSTRDAGLARHALGLSLVRQGRSKEAMDALAAAARDAPESSRFAYTYGVALYDAGRREEAVRTLEAALARHPYDREILFVLAVYDIKSGRLDRARARVRVLRELDPDRPELARLAATVGLPEGR